jgi:RNA polymerase sigma-70 factor (ECF subfamily)
MNAMVLEHNSISDAELIGRARSGDGAAFGQLVERHYDFVYRVAYRWLGIKQDAEDAAQEVCIRIAKALKSYQGNGAFTSWLYPIALNAARDIARKRSRDNSRNEAFGVHSEVTGGGSDKEDEERVEALWLAVAKLSDKQRETVLLVYGEGYSHAQAAEALGISEPTVSWHVHEAKKRLRVLIREAGEV